MEVWTELVNVDASTCKSPAGAAKQGAWITWPRRTRPLFLQLSAPLLALREAHALASLP